jgi:hypothetical protein
MASRTSNPGRSTAALALGALVLTAVSCGEGNTPASPNPPPVVVAATPAPSPPPEEVVEASSCPLGPGTVETTCSTRGGSTHLGDVQEAIDRIVQARPELFDRGEESPAGSGQYRVLDVDAYLDAVVGELQAAGLCAQRGYDGETVQVKSSNDLSEDFDVILSSGHIRLNAHVISCQPAAFPVTPGQLIHKVRVAFWSFDCDPGIASPDKHAGLLPLGCDGSVTATPKDRDGLDVPPSIHGSAIEWELRRGDEVIKVLEDWRFPNPFNKVLRAKGPIDAFQLCATVEGVEGCLSGNTIP